MQHMYDAVPVEVVEAWKSPKVDASCADATHKPVISYVTISSDSEGSSNSDCRGSRCNLSLLRPAKGLAVRTKDIVTIDSDSSLDIDGFAATSSHSRRSYRPLPIKTRPSVASPLNEKLLMTTLEKHPSSPEALVADVASQVLPVSEVGPRDFHFSRPNAFEEETVSLSSLHTKKSALSADSSPNSIKVSQASAQYKRARQDNDDSPAEAFSVDEGQLSCLMPFCETQGRVLLLDCGHAFCTGCLESQRLAKPKKKRSHYRPNLKRSKSTRAHVHVRMKCALCMRSFKMSLLELASQPGDAVQRASIEGSSSACVQPVDLRPQAQDMLSCSDSPVTPWKQWDLCWAQVVRERACSCF
jgi:hypothetical protein